VVLGLGLVAVGSGVARADDGPPGIVEHTLVAMDAAPPVSPSLWKGDLPGYGVWDFARDHLDAQARFSDPFLGPELFPEVSAGTLLVGTRQGGASTFEGKLNLELYWLSVRLPLEQVSTDPTSRADLDVKLPLGFGHGRQVALLLGASVPLSGEPISKAGGRVQVIVGRGGHTWDAQARLGVASQAPEGQPAPDTVAQALFGASGGFHFRSWGRVELEVDGAAGRQGAKRLAVAPGLRFFPTRQQDVSLGVAGLFKLQDQADQSFGARSLGGLLQLSYTFL
jgi:hypothetical protein